MPWDQPHWCGVRPRPGIHTHDPPASGIYGWGGGTHVARHRRRLPVNSKGDGTVLLKRRRGRRLYPTGGSWLALLPLRPSHKIRLVLEGLEKGALEAYRSRSGVWVYAATMESCWVVSGNWATRRRWFRCPVLDGLLAVWNFDAVTVNPDVPKLSVGALP